MSNAIQRFFDAWELGAADARAEKITSAVTNTVRYDDPRTPDTVVGVDALCEYVGMFSANAPGWSAKVVGTDTTAGLTRATVAFGGLGPDGKEMIQHGQYFIEMDDELITRMVGFVGTGSA